MLACTAFSVKVTSYQNRAFSHIHFHTTLEQDSQATEASRTLFGMEERINRFRLSGKSIAWFPT